MQVAALEGDEKLLARRLLDLCESVRGQGAPRFTHFLNEREQLIARTVLQAGADVQIHFYGGYPDAMRRMVGIFPDYIPPEEDMFPLTILSAVHGKGEKLSHRTVLGTLMSLGIARESIGDILPDDGVCRFLVLDTVADAVSGDLVRIGRTGVRCQREEGAALVSVQEFENLRGTVSSPRMDSLVHLLTGLSREKACGLIRAGIVQKNYVEVSSVSAPFAGGDIVSIRGYGKFAVDEIGEPTRKGRLPVLARKYK